jgi:hypothetical protein
VHFIVANAAKHDLDEASLVQEIQQLGLPKENSDAIGRQYREHKVGTPLLHYSTTPLCYLLVTSLCITVHHYSINSSTEHSNVSLLLPIGPTSFLSSGSELSSGGPHLRGLARGPHSGKQ